MLFNFLQSDENNVLDSEKAFVSLALFNILRFPLSWYKQNIRSKRVSNFSTFCFLTNRHNPAFMSSNPATQQSRGWFHKGWAQGANHRDSSIKVGARRKVHPTPLKSFSKVGRRARIGRKKFMKSTPGPTLEWCPKFPRRGPVFEPLLENQTINAQISYKPTPVIHILMVKAFKYGTLKSLVFRWIRLVYPVFEYPLYVFKIILRNSPSSIKIGKDYPKGSN